MENSAQAGAGGGCMPTSFHSTVFTITYKVAVYAPAEREDTYTHRISSLPYMYSVVITINKRKGRESTPYVPLI